MTEKRQIFAAQSCSGDDSLLPCRVSKMSSWDRGHHCIEAVFLGAERDRGTVREQLPQNLEPPLVPVPELDKIGARAPIGGPIRDFARCLQVTA